MGCAARRRVQQTIAVLGAGLDLSRRNRHALQKKFLLGKSMSVSARHSPVAQVAYIDLLRVLREDEVSEVRGTPIL